MVKPTEDAKGWSNEGSGRGLALLTARRGRENNGPAEPWLRMDQDLLSARQQRQQRPLVTGVSVSSSITKSDMGLLHR
jgi:hypothetical protein